MQTILHFKSLSWPYNLLKRSVYFLLFICVYNVTGKTSHLIRLLYIIKYGCGKEREFVYRVKIIILPLTEMIWESHGYQEHN